MADLHQIQIRYVALEDRALMRISTTDQAQFQFWITRRYAELMLRALAKDLASSELAVRQRAPSDRDTVLAFEHDRAIAQTRFDVPYRAPRHEHAPLGETPVLLARIEVRRLDGGQSVLAMHPDSGKGVELRLDDRLIHSLVKLLQDAASRGQWALPRALAQPCAPRAAEPLN